MPLPSLPKTTQQSPVKSACESVRPFAWGWAAMQRMLDATEPYVLDIIVPYTEHVLPFIPANRTVADMIWQA